MCKLIKGQLLDVSSLFTYTHPRAGNIMNEKSE